MYEKFSASPQVYDFYCSFRCSTYKPKGILLMLSPVVLYTWMSSNVPVTYGTRYLRDELTLSENKKKIYFELKIY